MRRQQKNRRKSDDRRDQERADGGGEGLMAAVDHCRHGHAGWMYQRVMFDGRRNRWYACWVCRECERLRNQECSRRRRHRLAVRG
jgi:hypothetical protein